MARYAIASTMPGSRYDFNWPASGEATIEKVVEGVPDPSKLLVFELRTAHLGLHHQINAKWVVLELDEDAQPDRRGVIDFKRGQVLFNGPWKDATDFLRSRGLPVPRSEIREIRTGCDGESFTLGDHSVGIGSTASSITAGHASQVFVGSGEATVGSDGDAIVFAGKAIGGDRSLAVARAGSAAVGERGIAIAMYEGGSVQAGPGGLLVLVHLPGSRYTHPWKVAVVGQNGILPNVPYRLDVDGNFVRATPQE
jgi:hypothetical protein